MANGDKSNSFITDLFKMDFNELWSKYIKRKESIWKEGKTEIPYSAKELAKSHELIKSTKPNSVEFKELLKKIESGDDYAEYVVGRIYYSSIFNSKKGLEHILNSAEQGSSLAKIFIEENIREFQNKIDKRREDADSEFMIGRAHYSRFETHTKGLEYISNAARHGSELAKEFIKDRSGVFDSWEKRKNAPKDPPRTYSNELGYDGCATAALIVFIYIPFVLFVFGGIIGLLWFGIKQLF